MQSYLSMFIINKDMPIITIGISILATSQEEGKLKALEVYNEMFPELPYTAIITKLR